MSKRLEELKKDLMQLADAVNAFQSESVQVLVIGWVLDQLEPVSGKKPNASARSIAPSADKESGQPAKETRLPRRQGVTYLLKDLLATDYFNTARTLGEILHYINEPQADTPWQSHDISGVLLKLVDQGKLARRSGENKKSFRYTKISS